MKSSGIFTWPVSSFSVVADWCRSPLESDPSSTTLWASATWPNVLSWVKSSRRQHAATFLLLSCCHDLFSSVCKARYCSFLILLPCLSLPLSHFPPSFLWLPSFLLTLFFHSWNWHSITVAVFLPLYLLRWLVFSYLSCFSFFTYFLWYIYSLFCLFFLFLFPLFSFFQQSPVTAQTSRQCPLTPAKMAPSPSPTPSSPALQTSSSSSSSSSSSCPALRPVRQLLLTCYSVLCLAFSSFAIPDNCLDIVLAESKVYLQVVYKLIWLQVFRRKF